MKASEVRRRFLRFFEERGHQVLRSDSLVPPAEDKSLLFTGAGMNQFKNEFMGRGKPGLKRAATSQKCFRTGDVDNVGRTAFHHTFFEMLGNFSFGDYFKREAILWAWEFMTQEMKLPPERLRVSVYEEDDEAFDLWQQGSRPRPEDHLPLRPARQLLAGGLPRSSARTASAAHARKSSTITARTSAAASRTASPRAVAGGSARSGTSSSSSSSARTAASLDPLPTRNIDTGMGLERMAAVMQGVRTSFDTDLFMPIIQADRARDGKGLRARPRHARRRRLPPHRRPRPRRGVLHRRRRAARQHRPRLRPPQAHPPRRARRRPARKKSPFLYSLVPVVARVMEDQYPDLAERRENIAHLISSRRSASTRRSTWARRSCRSSSRNCAPTGEQEAARQRSLPPVRHLRPAARRDAVAARGRGHDDRRGRVRVGDGAASASARARGRKSPPTSSAAARSPR